MEDWTCIICGVTGDLGYRKLLPAIYELVGQHDFTENDFLIIGCAYEEASFSAIWDEVVQAWDSYDEERLAWLKERSYYYALDFSDADGFKELSHTIARKEHAFNLPGNRLVYCAVPADFFCDVTQYIVDEAIVEPSNERHRIVYEKPFGRNYASAQEINACIHDNGLQPQQVYRVDHYLSKEFISNITLLRFTNELFEGTWHRDYIDRIEIYCKESLTVSGRGAYYDRYGASRDMVQSHMLQMLALTAMERPDRVIDRGMEAEKTHVLQNTHFVTGVRGQYEGYRQEENVDTESQTETAFVGEWRINTDRWRDVPIYMLTGKAMDEKRTEIRIVYKASQHAFFKETITCDPDILIIRVAQKSGFILYVNSKQPNSIRETMPVKLDFCHSCRYGPYTQEAYENLLASVFIGEQSISVSAQEIEQQWRIIEEALQSDLPLYTYQQGEDGEDLMKKVTKKE